MELFKSSTERLQQCVSRQDAKPEAKPAGSEQQFKRQTDSKQRTAGSKNANTNEQQTEETS